MIKKHRKDETDKKEIAAFSQNKNAQFLFGLKKNFPKYCESFIKIAPREGGGLVPFVLNSEQIRVNDIFEAEMRKKGYVRLLILKARKRGITSYSCARSYHTASLNMDNEVVLIAHRDEDTRKIFEKISTIHEEMNEALKPETRRASTREIDMRREEGRGGLRSSIRCVTAGADDPCRGSNIRAVHGSEIAFWPPNKASDIHLGIMNSMPSSGLGIKGTWVIYESTANGEGNLFHRMWYATGDDWTRIFIPWYWADDYKRSVPDEVYWPAATNLPDYGYWERFKNANDLAEEEVQLSRNNEITLEHLCWRRFMIANYCQGNIDKFHQEYPSTAEEAFVVTGDTFCDVPSIQWHARLKPAKVPLCGNLVAPHPGNQKIVVFQPHPKGSWILYDYLEDNGKIKPHKQGYSVGADTAEGIDVGALAGQGSDPDWSCAYVVGDKRNCTTATYRARVRPDVFAEELRKAHFWFERAIIVPEVNSMGIGLLPHLQDVHLYHREETDVRTQKKSRHQGWRTTSANRAKLVAMIEEEIRHKDHQIYCPTLLSEAKTLAVSATGKVEAKSGCHDDMLFAFGLALVGANKFYHYDARIGRLADDRKGPRKAGDVDKDQIRLVRRQI